MYCGVVSCFFSLLHQNHTIQSREIISKLLIFKENKISNSKDQHAYKYAFNVKFVKELDDFQTMTFVLNAETWDLISIT